MFLWISLWISCGQTVDKKRVKVIPIFVHSLSTGFSTRKKFTFPINLNGLNTYPQF